MTNSDCVSVFPYIESDNSGYMESRSLFVTRVAKSGRISVSPYKEDDYRAHMEAQPLSATR